MSDNTQAGPRMSPPAPGEYDRYYASYIERAAGSDVIELLADGPAATRAALARLSDAEAATHPAPGEWSAKEVLSHLCDFERVFAYRAMHFSRQSGLTLHTFEQDQFVARSNANARPLADLLEEFEHLRNATVLMFESMTAEMLALRGTASSAAMSVRAVAFVIAGHEIGHREDQARIHRPP
jgi:uncharacterized damage-inducible protein DinB